MNEKSDEFPRSFVLVEFAAPGSVYMRIASENVVPMQLFALSEYLRVIAENELAEQNRKAKEQAERNKILVPEGKIVK